MKSIIHIVTSLRTNEVCILPKKGESAQTKYLGIALKMRANEKRTNENRMNQGLGVYPKIYP